MAVNVATLEARLEANTRDFDTDMKRAANRVRDFDDAAGKATKRSMAFKAGLVAAGAAAAIGAAKFARFAFDSTQLAVAAEEAGSAFSTTFGPATGDASRFVEEFANKAGFANFELEQMLAVTGNVVQGLGGTEEQSLILSKRMATLAGDVASFSNAAGGAEAVLGALKSALTGEFEAMKTYGIVLRAAEVEQRALAMSGKAVVGELTALDKALATVEIASERAGKAVGDLDRTVDSAANQQRRLAAEVKEMQVALGQGLLPLLRQGLPVLISWAEAMADAFGRRTPGIIDDFATSIQQAGDVTRQAFEGVLSDRQLERFERLGVNLQEVRRAALGDEDAFDRIKKSLRAYGDVQHKVQADILKLRDAFAEAGEAVIAADRAQRDHARHQGRHGAAIDRTTQSSATLAEKMQQARAQVNLWAEGLNRAAPSTQELASASELMEQRIAAAVRGSIQVMGDLPEAMTTTVDQMMRNAQESFRLQKLFEDNMRLAAEHGLDALVDQMEKDSPAAADSYAELLHNNLDRAIALDSLLAGEVTAAAEALMGQNEAELWQRVGLFIGQNVEAGFNPNLSVTATGGGGNTGGGPVPVGGGIGPGLSFDPMAIMTGVTGGAAAPAAVAAAAATTGGGTVVNQYFDGAVMVGSGIEDHVLAAWQRLQREGRVK